MFTYQELLEPGFLTMKLIAELGVFFVALIFRFGRRASCTAEVLQRLCKRADSVISSSEQIRHIVKGVHENAFHVVLVKTLTTVADVTSFYKALDGTNPSRICLRSTPTSSDTITLRNCISLDALRTIIRDIVRDELYHRDRVSPSRPSLDQYINFGELLVKQASADIPL